MRLISGTWAVTLTTGAAVAALSAGSAFGAAHVARPTITGFFPTTASSGTTILIAGNHLTGATSVSLNGLKVTFKVYSAKAISAKVPAGAKSGKLVVSTRAGTVTSKAALAVVPFRHA
jgi:hypothetical protein